MEEKKKQRLIAHFGQEWFEVLEKALNHSFYTEMSARINKMRQDGHIIYPAGADTYKAFRLTPFSKVKVVWLGQDPYPNEMANGLSFDCSNGPSVSPSWAKILEAYNEYDKGHFNTNMMDGDLSHLAAQGFLMLNAALTVPRGRSGAHLPLWRPFTRTVIKKLVKRENPPVFVLLGKQIQEFADDLVAELGTKVLSAEHPAFAARQHRAWLHNNIFGQLSEHLGEDFKWSS